MYSFFPVDPHDCECKDHIEIFKRQLGEMTEAERSSKIEQMGSFECSRPKDGMQRYEITCNNCGQIQGYLWATDPSLKDWCDFHYVNWTDGNEWFGCLTPNISPISGELGIECTCGYDTRDFRANMTLNMVETVKMEDRNKEGREFDKPGSKFTARVITANIKPRFDLGELTSIKVDRPGS